MDFTIQRGVSSISRADPNWMARVDCLGDSAWTQWSAPSSSPALDGHHAVPPLARPGSARHAHSDRCSRPIPRRNLEPVAYAVTAFKLPQIIELFIYAPELTSRAASNDL